jgi:hypothetical protein
MRIRRISQRGFDRESELIVSSEAREIVEQVWLLRGIRPEITGDSESQCVACPS